MMCTERFPSNYCAVIDVRQRSRDHSSAHGRLEQHREAIFQSMMPTYWHSFIVNFVVVFDIRRRNIWYCTISAFFFYAAAIAAVR